MPIDVACPQCGHSYQVRDEAAGRRFKCKECGDVVPVPGLAVEETGSSTDVDPESVAPIDERGSTRLPPRRGDAEAEPAERVWLAKTSLILGCIVWCLVIVGFLVLVVFGVWVSRQGGGQPDDEDMLTVAMMGLGVCGVGCLGLALSLVGVSLGVIAMTQPAEPRGQAIGGLVLNGFYLVGSTILVLISVLARQV